MEIWYFIKKKMKIIKTLILWQKKTKKAKKHSLFWIYPTDPWCNTLQTLERRINIEAVSFCQTNTLAHGNFLSPCHIIVLRLINRNEYIIYIYIYIIYIYIYIYIYSQHIMSKNDWIFCDQIFQAVATLDKKNFTFLNFNSSFF